jgi:peroxiredoxin
MSARLRPGARAARGRALCAILAVSPLRAAADAPPAITAGDHAGQPPAIGAAVPDFSAASLRGEPVSLKAALQDHKAVVVLFLSTVCPYAKYFTAHVRELSEQYGPRGVLFVGINPNRWETKDEVAEQARQDGFAFPMIKDEHHVIADQLGARATPEAMIVDSEGRLRYRGWVKSRQESPDLQHALDAVLEGKPVRRPETKAFGCAIDRK